MDSGEACVKFRPKAPKQIDGFGFPQLLPFDLGKTLQVLIWEKGSCLFQQGFIVSLDC